jgi:hypothetical protein
MRQSSSNVRIALANELAARGTAMPGGRFALNRVNEFIQAHRKRSTFLKKTPPSAFIDLDKKKQIHNKHVNHSRQDDEQDFDL